MLKEQKTRIPEFYQYYSKYSKGSWKDLKWFSKSSLKTILDLSYEETE